jgi:hypothetical protein
VDSSRMRMRSRRSAATRGRWSWAVVMRAFLQGTGPEPGAEWLTFSSS